MTDLLDEISEDLREEKYSRIIQKTVRIFTIVGLLVISGVSLYVWKENNTEKLQLQLGKWFNQAIMASENKKLDEAISYLDKIIDHSHQQYAVMAYLNKASFLFQQNKFAQGQEVLLKITEHKHFDLAIRELAEITYLSNKLSDSHPIDDKTKSMLDKLSNENKPWKLSALQLKALYDIKSNNIADAKANLKKILESSTATRASYESSSSILSAISRTE